MRLFDWMCSQDGRSAAVKTSIINLGWLIPRSHHAHTPHTHTQTARRLGFVPTINSDLINGSDETLSIFGGCAVRMLDRSRIQEVLLVWSATVTHLRRRTVGEYCGYVRGMWSIWYLILSSLLFSTIVVKLHSRMLEHVNRYMLSFFFWVVQT